MCDVSHTAALVHVPFGEWCHIHWRHEPPLPGDYMVCGECWHVWRTVWDFYLSELEIARQMFADDPSIDGIWMPADLTKVYSCPLCAHDF